MSCGRAVCPPGPVSVTSIRSQAAVIAPVRRPTVPDGHGRVAVQGERPRGAVEHAGGDDLDARRRGWSPRPAGRPAAPCRAGRRSRPGRRATPSTTVVCTSCPQAWHMPSRVDAYGTSFRSASGSASMSARRTTTGSPEPTSQTRPVPAGSRRGRQPVRAQPLLEEGRWSRTRRTRAPGARAGAGASRPAARGARPPSRRRRRRASRRPGSCRGSPGTRCGAAGRRASRRAGCRRPAVRSPPCAAATARCRW